MIEDFEDFKVEMKSWLGKHYRLSPDWRDRSYLIQRVMERLISVQRTNLSIRVPG